MAGHAQSYKVVMMADAAGGNCISCRDAIMTQQPANSLNQAYEAEKSFRKQYGMIPSIYILKPNEAAVIIEYTEKVGNCSCTKKMVLIVGTPDKAVQAFEQKKAQNKAIRETGRIIETWPINTINK